ncbi:sensor histidine kinase [Sedimentibacter sp.]|uniref:ATP-binding protein n=2 Tax=Sedimentibacter sp. TaxID=1960295 RepID=UPI0028B02AE1|nr:sensor histidine kinase [Sedimentibacter sp.]
MKELSMHILDIAMNSISAGSKLIEIIIEESNNSNLIKIIIKDDGCGMSDDTIKRVTDPFYTTRTTRKVGLGIPLLKEACERCNGYFNINSEIGKGTTVECSFERDNIDRAPVGNMGDTIITIINSLNNCELLYNYSTDEKSFVLSTLELRNILGGADIKSNDILLWVKEYINENMKNMSNY